MKKLFSFFAAALMAVSMSAETVTFAFKTDNDITYTASGTSGGGAKCEVSKDDVTLVGSNAYTIANKTLSVYANSTLSISVVGKINQIDLVYNGDVYPFDEALGEGTKGTKLGTGSHNASYTPETPAATIVLTNSNKGKTDLLSLTVDYTPGEAVKVTGIALDKSELAMMGGDIVNLVATISPADASDKGIIWSTSDEKVATVSDGAVTAVGKGNATITAETKDGGYKATCAVSVSIKEAPEGAIFFETFDKMNGTGANDGAWSGTIASGAVATSDFDNEGWSTEGTLGKANKSLCIRKNGNDAALPSGATTPALGKAGNGKVQFMAESWGSDGSNFFVDIVGEGSFVANENLEAGNISNEGKTAKVIMAKASKWTTFTLQFEGVTADSKIRFYAPAGKRAFMDEVAIWVGDAPAAGWDGTVTTSLDGQTVNGVEDFEGIVLTLNNASSIAYDEDYEGYFALQNEDGSELYAYWYPAFGGEYVVDGDKVTLTNWYTGEGMVAIPAETTVIYLEDYGVFDIDGEIQYAFEEDLQFAYEAPAPVEEGCDWDNIAALGDGAQGGALTGKYKICVPAESGITPNNIQRPGFCAEDAIHVPCPTADRLTCSLPEGKFYVDGAGLFLYISAFTAVENNFTISWGDATEYDCVVWYADGVEPKTTVDVTIDIDEENVTFTPDNNELQYAIALLPWNNYVEAATSANPEAAIFSAVLTFTTSTMGMFVKTGEQSVALAYLQELLGDGTFAVVAVGITNEFDQNGEIAWKKIEFAAELPEFDVTVEAKKTVFCVTPADNTISYGIVAITADEIEYSTSWGYTKEQVLNSAQQRIYETYTGYHYFGYESDLYAYAAGELNIVVWAGTYDEEEDEFVPSHKMQVYTVELKEDAEGNLYYETSTTGVENAEVESLSKTIVNGELVIVKDGVRYNVLGARK